MFHIYLANQKTKHFLYFLFINATVHINFDIIFKADGNILYYYITLLQCKYNPLGQEGKWGMCSIFMSKNEHVVELPAARKNTM